jgi:uncharacterized membrane protein
LKKDKFTFPRQLVGIAVIFAVIIVAFIVGRMLFVPASFGKYGHYRADAVDEIAQVCRLWGMHHLSQQHLSVAGQFQP